LVLQAEGVGKTDALFAAKLNVNEFVPSMAVTASAEKHKLLKSTGSYV